MIKNSFKNTINWKNLFKFKFKWVKNSSLLIPTFETIFKWILKKNKAILMNSRNYLFCPGTVLGQNSSGQVQDRTVSGLSWYCRWNFPSIIHLKCNYHFKNLKELTKTNHFKAKNLKPTEIPGAYKPYFLTRAVLDKRKRNHYSPHRIFKYDLSILNKLKTRVFSVVFWRL